MRRLCQDRRLWAGPAPMQPYQADDFLFWATLGTVLGGRIGFFLFYEPSMLLKDPLQFFQIWQGGMAFHGGLLGVGLAVLLFARRQRIPVRSLMDLSAAAVPFGLFFGRLANFVNAEIYGRLTDVSWAVEFPVKALLKGDLPGPRHPTQIYEALLEGVVMFVLLRFFTHSRRSLHVAGADHRRFPDGLWRVPHLRRIFQGMGQERLARSPFTIGHRPISPIGMVYSLPMIVYGAYLAATAKKAPAKAGKAPAASPVEA